MDDSERQKYETKSQELRAELKKFEGDWGKKNGGKKPSREDIKKNPIIAQKYKKYQQLGDILSGKVQPPRKPESKEQKRKPIEAPSQTPVKRSRLEETPSKSRQIPDVIESFETPTLRRLFSPAVPTSIGPTPQKDGRVLGLFDLLAESEEGTPSKGRDGPADLPEISIQATPSKRKADAMDAESEVKLGRTPMSSSKRIMLDTFLTPLKRRDLNAGSKTPGSGSRSVSKLQFATPAFLKRAPMPSVDENGEYVSPQAIRLPRKPLVRSLSSLVASLRKVEEDRLDDDLEALHEIENEMADEPRPAPMPKKATEDILVPDSQAGQLLLGGFDDEGLYDSAPEAELGRDGQPLRIYKKKGQKRTTRRVNMRPTRSKRPQQSVDGQEHDDQTDDDTVPETQREAFKAGAESLDLGSGSDFDGASDEGRGEGGDHVKKPKAKKPTAKDGKIQTVKKAARKVNALAHTNFKRLKLKNHGAKGGPGFGSRFRRRR